MDFWNSGDPTAKWGRVLKRSRTELASGVTSRFFSVWPLILALSAVLGVLLRLDGIGSSLWMDEFGTLWVVEGSLREVWIRASNFQGQSPFYYSFVWLALQLFGESEIALRIPSLLFGLSTWGVLSIGAWILFGSQAGLCAFLIAALDPTLIHASADARPYGLAFLMLALTTVGFVRASLTGDATARYLWMIAGAGTMWAHYVFYPFVFGIVCSYVVIPTFRRRYKPGIFRRDLLIHLLLVGIAVPQLIQLLARRETLDWVSKGHTGGGLVLMTMPYWISIALGAIAVGTFKKPKQSVYQALWTCLMLGMLGFLGLKILGTNIIHWRYVQGALIAILLLSAGALAVLNRRRASVSLIIALLLLATVLESNRRFYGTYTLLGFEDWRQATATLDGELNGDTRAPVLFRSGFIEEDHPPLGFPVPATRAPLRSPGRMSPDWNVVSLTSSWGHPDRETYFVEHVLPQLDDSDRFYMLVRSGRYASSMINWIEGMRPDVFVAQIRTFGQVVLVKFDRVPEPDS